MSCNTSSTWRRMSHGHNWANGSWNLLWYTSSLDYKHVSRMNYAHKARFYCRRYILEPGVDCALNSYSAYWPKLQWSGIRQSHITWLWTWLRKLTLTQARVLSLGKPAIQTLPLQDVLPLLPLHTVHWKLRGRLGKTTPFPSIQGCCHSFLFPRPACPVSCFLTSLQKRKQWKILQMFLKPHTSKTCLPVFLSFKPCWLQFFHLWCKEINYDLFWPLIIVLYFHFLF